MPNFFWTLLLVFLALLAITRLIAWIAQWYLRKYHNVQVKVGQIGLFRVGKVQFLVKSGLNVEIGQIWLSSCFVNQEIRKPLVLCIQEVRMQDNREHSEILKDAFAPRKRTDSNIISSEDAEKMSSMLHYVQFFGVRVENITVMLLKTFLPDSLIHWEVQDISVDATVTDTSLDLVFNFTSVTCKALRPSEGTPDSLSQPCLAELSVSTFAEIQFDRKDPKKLTGVKFLVSKPIMMMTEGFLQSLQEIKGPSLSKSSAADDMPSSDEETMDEGILKKTLKNLKKASFDCSDMNVKILREKKQRSLSVGLKLCHINFHNHSKNNLDMSCNLNLEDFQTSSSQARFAGLTNVEIKLKIVKDSIINISTVKGGFFHYHHDEIQYWTTVLQNVMKQGENSSQPVLASNAREPSQLKSSVVKWINEKKVEYEIELCDLSSTLSSASCSGFHGGVSLFKVSGCLKPTIGGAGSKDYMLSHDVIIEIDVNCVYCWHIEAGVPVELLGKKKHYWDHILYLEMMMIKAKKMGKQFKIEGMKDNLQIEWSTSTLNMLLQLMSSLFKSKQQQQQQQKQLPLNIPPTDNTSNQQTFSPPLVKRPTSSTSSSSPLNLLMAKFEITNVNIFIANDLKVCLMLRTDNIIMEHKQSKSTVGFTGLKLVYLHQQEPFQSLTRSVEMQKPVASIKEIRVTHKLEENEMTIQVIKELLLVWTTHSHMCFLQGLQDAQLLLHKVKGYCESNKEESEVKVSNVKKAKSKLQVNVLIHADVKLTGQLSKQHEITLQTDSILLTGKLPSCLMEITNINIRCDQHNIFKLKDVVFETLSPTVLQRERQAAGNLQLRENRTWGISFEGFRVVFPYSYNFAACFEEVVNTFKWLKLVHKIEKKPFTVNSKLPPDLRILVKMFSVQLSDDPFEVKLGDNYELLKDEYYESITRKDVLDAKIGDLQRQHGIIPASRIEDLYSSLSRKSADIYIQRSKQYYTSPQRTKLFTWTMENVEITALADLSFHGKENVVKHMREIDSDSPYPADGLEFSTLWCRSVNFSVKTWLVRLRDYPLPMLDVRDMHVWGRLIGAEQEAARRARRTCDVEVNKPWGDMKVERSLPPLKFFHDFSCDMKALTMAYGVCWEAAFAQFNICLDLVNKPSIDPSQPLPFWDKIRLIYHGRWTMSIGKMSWLYHAQFDPFNNTELMDWTWTNVVLDWTNGKFLLKGDLDISAKTESKYDDCKIFHLPNLRFCVRLDWLCLGDPNDHHAVMPCAPDRVPDYSMEEHDSFRAFRSEKLNLDISLETQQIKENPEDIPCCYFYASTLRFMDKIKSCMLSTTRPIRRGKLFKTTTKRKLQLSRHYKKIKMSVNFHQFLIRYWMSFAKQHGFEVLSDFFTLNMCNKLALRPIEDGLIHRPASEWSVSYLICNLGNTKTWLCQAMPQDGEESFLNMSIRGPVDKSFFLSVANVTYKRGEKSKRKASECKEDKTDQITPTHRVEVFEMKGSWTKKNRMVLIGIYDSYQKAQSLRRNLSSEALKGFKVEGKEHGNSKTTSMSSLVSGTRGSPVVATSPLSKLQTGHALSMLMKLVSESDSKSVAFTEEPSSSNLEQLYGVRACQTDDVVQKNWLIELHNSQIILKGCESPGYVIVSAAKAQILSCLHHPIWRNGQLRSKTTWVGSVECMQYYANVDPGGDFDDDEIPWLGKENVEDRFASDISGVPEMVGSGHSVGGVISNTVGPSVQKSTIQLQRIISRCKCQFFYVNYGDLKANELPEVPLPPTDDSDMMDMEEGIDAFTILHHDLNMCSNPLQYTIILDIVNNLLLYVEPKEKEARENLQSMRFRLQLSRVADQKTPILHLQEKVRSKALELRRHEKELHKLQKEIDEYPAECQLLEESRELQVQLNKYKTDLYKLNEELSIRINCYNESQLQVKQQMKMEKAQQADIVKRNEVCFKFAQWRLTEKDGQLGITDITLRNFVYTKVNRDDDTWTHQLELGWVKMTNLLPNSIYKDVLLPRDPIEKENRQMTLRILCSERPPVGGISVKEHFEVNVVPMQLQLTYHFYKAVMSFFFPDKNIEVDDQEDDMEGQKKKSEKKLSHKEKEKKELVLKRSPSFTSADDIDKMKERAANNNTFLYIKIPEVLLRVSYKGEKEKNIEDVHDFSFVLPTVEQHNCIWTWFDFLIAMKNHSKRILLSQAIKQKLHMKSRADEPPLTDVQQEEDKAKMLLGAKLLAGQDKPVKKSLFSKSHK